MASMLLKRHAVDHKTNRAEIVKMARTKIARDGWQGAESLIRGYEEENGATPEVLEARSWVARALLNDRHFARAIRYASRVHRLTFRRLRTASPDAEPHIAIALGASIEVIAQAMAHQCSHVKAVRFLKQELVKFGTTSIRTRIRKNLNILTLEGQRAPELEIREWLGSKPQSLTKLRGRPVLLFFWVHYCEDSRTQGRVLTRVWNRFSQRGLMLIAPTRRYGHLDEHRQRPAAARQEKQYIDKVFSKSYAGLAGMSVPISERNFDVYGVSATPTLVLVDRDGIVSFYHPGKVPYKDLVTRVKDLLNP